MGRRYYQVEQSDSVKAARARGVMRQLLIAATGTGKTVFMANLPDDLAVKDRTIVTVHREELAKQACDKIRKWNPHRNVQVEMADRRAGTDADVVVASIQTLYARDYKRLSELLDQRPIGLVMNDEAHHYVAAKYAEAINRMMNSYSPLLVGVTATPNRGDGAAMAQMYDEIVHNYPMRRAIDDGYLADVRGFKVSTSTDISGVKTQAGDFNPGQLQKAVNTPVRNKQIVDVWLEMAWDRQTIAFCVDIQHSKDLAFEFQKRGIPAEAVWGTDPDREKKLAMHRSGHLKVLVNCNVLTEGYDDWRIGCIIMAKPTKSQLLYVQMAGRGTRIPDGVDNLLTAHQAGVKLEKSDCLILDVVDVTGRHSLVTLPTLFGLSPKMDLNGKSANAIAKKAEEIQQQNPHIDVTKVEDTEVLDTIVQRADLWEIKWEPEVVENSKLAWQKAVDGSYFLRLPTGERVTLRGDALGVWKAEGTVNNMAISSVKHNSLQDALLFADMNVSLMGPEHRALLRRESEWRKKKASPKTVALLVKTCRIPKHEAEQMTQEQAGVKLHQKWDRFKKRGPAPVQRQTPSSHPTLSPTYIPNIPLI